MALSVVVSLGLGGFYDAPRPHGNSGPKDAGHQLPNNVYIQLVRLLSLSHQLLLCISKGFSDSRKWHQSGQMKINNEPMGTLYLAHEADH